MPPKKKIDTNKKVNKSVTIVSSGKAIKHRSQAQNEAAVRNLVKAREAKQKYQKLRKEGFNRENVTEATNIIANQLDRLSSFSPESNPAVAQLMAELNGRFPTANELADMTNSEYYRYATSLRSFLGHSLSDENSINKLFDKISYEVIGTQLTRKKNERMSSYHRRRSKFISEHEETAKEAFKLYRQLESTHAGVILRGKVSPRAYGSDNLITDLFDFIENDYDGNFDAAVRYWQDQLTEQYRWEEQMLAEDPEATKLTKFDWTGREKYASFVSRNYQQNS